MSRLQVNKKYKLYSGRQFPRSESGRTYEVLSAKGAFLANAAQGSRKDARDAVVAARAEPIDQRSLATWLMRLTRLAPDRLNRFIARRVAT